MKMIKEYYIDKNDETEKVQEEVNINGRTDLNLFALRIAKEMSYTGEPCTFLDSDGKNVANAFWYKDGGWEIVVDIYPAYGGGRYMFHSDEWEQLNVDEYYKEPGMRR